MSVIAKVVVPATDFPSRGVLSADGGNTVQLERVAADGEQPTPYFWVGGDEPGVALEEMTEIPVVDEIVTVDELHGRTLARIELVTERDSMFHALARVGATVLRAESTGNEWRLQLEFESHETFVEYYRWCIEEDVGIEVDRVHDPTDSRTASFEFALTETQRETLLTAFRRGYFDVPRDVNLVGLAEEFDISDTAVSQRLRRGTATLIAATLVDSSDGG